MADWKSGFWYGVIGKFWRWVVVDLSKKKIPKHIAVIMDGNRRWAAKRKMPVVAGHAYVVNKVIEKLIERAGELGVEYMTFWAWSTENWKRGEEEVGGIMKLFRMALEKKVSQMIERGARLRVIGDISRFPEDIKLGIERMVKASEKNRKIEVTFGLNYGGRDEILRAIGKLLAGGDREQWVIKEKLELCLDTAGMPDPDLIIRTGGEKRLSGFMLWQAEYAELYFTEVLMPDFGPDELDRAIEDYARRKRRFGGGRYEEYGGESRD